MKTNLSDEELIREVESLASKLSWPEIQSIQQLIYRYTSAICAINLHLYSRGPTQNSAESVPETDN